MKKQTSKAMEICASQVREISCARCLHYEKCVRNGYAPISMLGQYLAWLSLEALRPIENDLRSVCAKGIKLEAHAPNGEELEQDAYAVVRVYNEEANKRLICRVLLLDTIYDETHLRTLIFNAYIRRKGQPKNGKTTKA